MSSLSLLAAPLCLALVVGLLWLAAAAEQRLLSPRAVMAYSIRSRRCRPEQAEAIVAHNAERLLKGR
ncbi:MAG: hypothetical protein AB1673_14840 [Actinomycetota bacterium]|jgi:hypothetical protein